MDLGIQNLWLFILAGWALNLTPGPDVFYMVTHSRKSGWRAGAVAAAGITAGCFVHVAAATVGLSAIITASATAFMVLKWVGAAYLVYVGWQMLTSKSDPDTTQFIAKEQVNTWAKGQINYKKSIFAGVLDQCAQPQGCIVFFSLLASVHQPHCLATVACFLGARRVV
jgi:threonine/homoserine/homoserine lactone efflux protein